MSMAFEITKEDVQTALARMGVACSLDGPEVDAAFERVVAQDTRVTKAALRGNDLDEQTDFALDEILAVLQEEPMTILP